MPRSIEQIKATYPTVQDCRKEISRLNKELKKFHIKEPLMINGYELPISKTKKEHHLPEHISKLEGLLETHKNQTVETTEEITTPETTETTEETATPKKELKIDPDSEYTDSEQEKIFVAKKLYNATERENEFTGLKQYHLDFCKSKKLFSSENFSKFALLVAKARIFIEGYSNSKSPNGKGAAGRINQNKVEIMKYIRELCEKDKDLFEPVLERTLMDTFADFDDAVRGAFKDISKIKYELYKEKRDSGEVNVRNIKVSKFINWAKETVTNLPDNHVKWKEVCIAIMMLTGRRQSEVMSSGLFEYVDDSHLMFEGQLKRHTKEELPATKIPVIGGVTQQIINAIKWLEEGDKRTLPIERTYEGLQDAAKKSHNRCSRYISETMDKLEYLVEFSEDSKIKTWNDSKGKSVFKGHLTRQIYAQVCAELFKPDNQKKHSYIADILLENRDAAPSYDRDIEVIDTQDIN